MWIGPSGAAYFCPSIIRRMAPVSSDPAAFTALAHIRTPA
jgi:hypothetical protein